MRPEKISLAVILVVIGLFAINAAAQPPVMPDSTRIDRHVTMLKDRLNLTDTQANQIRAILDDEQKLAQADRDKYRGDYKAMDQAREKRRQETDGKIMKVLNKDQQKEFEKIQKDIRKGPRDNRPDKGPGKGPGRSGRGPGQGGPDKW